MQRKCYRISKILNNNAVEVIDGSSEIIVIGAGIGFAHKVKDYLIIKEDYKLFTLQNNMLKSQFEALLNEIPFECVELTQRIIDMAKAELEQDFKPGLIASLADHIYFVVKTYKEGKDSYSLVSEEIKRLYNQEYRTGLKAVELINSHYDISLNTKEASAIAFHLISSEYGGNINQTTKILDGIDDIVGIVTSFLDKKIAEDSLSYSRFVIHLKFFLQRVIRGNQEDDNSFEQLLISTKSEVSHKVGNILDAIGEYVLREFEHKLTDAERLYLLVHIVRFV